MTIDSPEVIRNMLRNNGVYQDDSDPAESYPDEQANSIWTYTNRFGKRTFKVCMHPGELEPSEFVQEPLVLWEKGRGLSIVGELVLRGAT